MKTHIPIIGILYISNGIYQFQFTTEVGTEIYLTVANVKECISILKKVSREKNIPNEVSECAVIQLPDDLPNMEAAIITNTQLVIYPDKFPMTDRTELVEFLFTCHSLEIERLSL